MKTREAEWDRGIGYTYYVVTRKLCEKRGKSEARPKNRMKEDHDFPPTIPYI